MATAPSGPEPWPRSVGAPGCSDLPDVRATPAAAFDTRLDRSSWLTGAALRGIAKRLRRHGYEVLATESFLVEESQGPLEPGELDRARTWGVQLAESLRLNQAQPARDADLVRYMARGQQRRWPRAAPVRSGQWVYCDADPRGCARSSRLARARGQNSPPMKRGRWAGNQRVASRNWCAPESQRGSRGRRARGRNPSP
jgi:hypothetical protein